MKKHVNHFNIPEVREFMTTAVVTVAPETEIYEAILFLLQHRVSGAPVVECVDGRKKVVGVLSEKDCLRLLSSGNYFTEDAGIVRDFMSTNVLTIRPEEDIFAVAAYFTDNVFRRLPVVDGDGYLIGIVARGDALRACKRVWEQRHYIGPPDPGYVPKAIQTRLGRQTPSIKVHN